MFQWSTQRRYFFDSSIVKFAGRLSGIQKINPYHQFDLMLERVITPHDLMSTRKDIMEGPRCFATRWRCLTFGSWGRE